jgi:UDPglucose 6-dehydrogenase
MKIAVIGTGYVGLVTGSCFAELGFDVICMDKDASKIARLKKALSPNYEEGLEELLARNLHKNRLSFTLSLKEALTCADVVFIAVSTPADPQLGSADLSAVFAVSKEIAPYLEHYTVVVTKSTVPVGTSRQIAFLVKEANPKAQFDVVSNPEFLREGSAIEDFMHPHRIIIGCETKKATQVMQELYNSFITAGVPLVHTSLETAELIKYASNAFLATKIAFMNEIADLCEVCGADVQDVSLGVGLDNRIGQQFLQPGPAYGGSCFPKDTRALAYTGRALGSPAYIVEAVIKSNEDRKQQMSLKIIAACQGNVQHKKIAVLGLTFKANTDDMRESPSIDIIHALQKAGARIAAFDPQGMKEAQKMFQDVEWATDPYEAMKEADALVILTEWQEFKKLDLEQVKLLLKSPLVIDLRNLYAPKNVEKHGLAYHSIGRALVYPEQLNLLAGPPHENY